MTEKLKLRTRELIKDNKKKIIKMFVSSGNIDKNRINKIIEENKHLNELYNVIYTLLPFRLKTEIKKEAFIEEAINERFNNLLK